MKFLVAVMLFITSSLVSAQTRIVSIDAFDLAYTGGWMFKHDEGHHGPDRDEQTFRLNLNYAQNIDQTVGLMWRGQVHLNRQDVDNGGNDLLISTFGASAGLLYNFQADDIKNSYLAAADVGIERATYKVGGEKNSGMNLYLGLEGGKRWDLGQYSVANISYAPTISLVLTRYGGAIRDNFYQGGRELRLNFLKFDILF